MVIIYFGTGIWSVKMASKFKIISIYSVNSLTSSTSSGDFKSGTNNLNKNSEEDILGKENINASAETNDDFNAEPPAIGENSGRNSAFFLIPRDPG